MFTETKKRRSRIQKTLKGIVTSVGLIAGMCSVNAVPASAANNYDTNGDGQVNTSDAVYIYKSLYDEDSKNESCRITAPLLQFFLDNPNISS